jgi:hypothetical protein
MGGRCISEASDFQVKIGGPLAPFAFSAPSSLLGAEYVAFGAHAPLFPGDFCPRRRISKQTAFGGFR